VAKFDRYAASMVVTSKVEGFRQIQLKKISAAKAEIARDGNNKLIVRRLSFEEWIEMCEVSELRHHSRQVSTTYDTSA
jgi:hypothetical protein